MQNYIIVVTRCKEIRRSFHVSRFLSHTLYIIASKSREQLMPLGISSNAIQNNGSNSRDQFLSTEFCHMQYKTMPVNFHIISGLRNRTTCNINQIMSAEFYHFHYNLIRIWICLHKSDTCQQVVADSVVQ